MRKLNIKLASAMCGAALGLLAMTSCEGGDLFNVNAPDWISSKVDSISAEKNKGGEEVLEGMNEDVYTVGAADFSTSFWTVFTKDYVIPNGQKWNAVLNLSINPEAKNTFKNFALVLTNDAHRGDAAYKEYGVIRFDNQPSGNSEWGDHIDRSCVESTLTFSTDTDEGGVQKLGGRVVITIDRTDGAFSVKMTNGDVTKTYKPKSPLTNLNEDTSNENIRAFLCPEGSVINFQQSNIEPIGGYTSAADKQPISLVLPETLPGVFKVGDDVADLIKDIDFTVNFEEGVSKVVKGADLTIQTIPDMAKPGTKQLVLIYNKTFKGENADKPVVASKEIQVVTEVNTIAVTKAPANVTYNVIGSELQAFNKNGMEVTATYMDGATAVLDNNKLVCDFVPGKAGEQEVKISYTDNGKTVSTTQKVTVKQVKTIEVGAADFTNGWWTTFTPDYKVDGTTVINLSMTSLADQNYQSPCVILRKGDMSEYAVVRMDNYGWKGALNTGANLDALGWTLTSDWNWDTFRDVIKDAEVVITVTVKGGKATVRYDVTGANGDKHFQQYEGIAVEDGDVQVALVTEESHLVLTGVTTGTAATRAKARRR